MMLIIGYAPAGVTAPLRRKADLVNFRKSRIKVYFRNQLLLHFAMGDRRK